MTLILSRNSGSYILQVSDRLVTRNTVPVDPESNKTIIFYARNAAVVMSYTGIAQLSNIPTDQWIAETLLGRQYDRGRKPPSIGPGTTKFIDIGLSLRILKSRFDELSQARTIEADRWRSSGFDLAIDGWQWDKKGHSRPLVAWLSKQAGEPSIKLGYYKREWYYWGRFLVGVAPAGYINNSELEAVRNVLVDKSPDESESFMASTIQSQSNKYPQIGPGCMSVLLLPPQFGYIRIKYIPKMIKQAMWVSSNQQQVINVGFTPWVIGPNIAFAPSYITGEGWELGVGHYVVEVSAPENPGSLGIFSSQHRRCL